MLTPVNLHPNDLDKLLPKFLQTSDAVLDCSGLHTDIRLL